jgi:glycosyltransferase involved in cell wall biosynthesis
MGSSNGDARSVDGGGLLWVAGDGSAPHVYLVEAARRQGELVRDLRWAERQDGRGALGRHVVLGKARTSRGYPTAVRMVSPRLLWEFLRSREDVLVIYEFGLVGFYAGLSKILRHQKVVALVEGDYRHLAQNATALGKVAFRRLTARFVDVIVANNPPAKDYLTNVIGVRPDKIVVGWWLAGFPAELTAHTPPFPRVPVGTPLFISASRLIAPKGVDLLINAVKEYRDRFGPCALWVIGDGPERENLAHLVQQLGIEDCVSFLGTIDPMSLKGAFEKADALVFPSLQDLTGRVVVEALTVGTPVVVSSLTGAAETLVRDGVNGFVVDPRDALALAECMHRTADPTTRAALRGGVNEMNDLLRPDAAADVVLRAVALARRNV